VTDPTPAQGGSPAGVSHLDRYHNRPLPEAWRALLSPLLPGPPDLPETEFSDLGARLDACLHPVGDAAPDPYAERNMEMLWQRVAEGLSGSVVAARHGLTKQRVSIIEQRLFEAVRTRAEADLGHLERQFAQGETLLRLRGMSGSRLWPHATAEQQWRLLAALVPGGRFEFRPLPPDRVLCVPPGALNLAVAEQLLAAQPRFWPLAEVARVTGCAALALRCAPDLGSPLRVTRGGRLMHADWTRTDQMHAVALELRGAGVHEWHFSEMAHAVSLIWPERPINHRQVGMVLSLAPAGLFTPGSKRGLWCLVTSPGEQARRDRPGLCEAMTAVLDASELPLTAEGIRARLGPERTHSTETVYSTLSAHPQFRLCGRGVFTLTGRALPKVPEEAWAAAVLEGEVSGTLSRDALHQAAVRDGIDLERLELVGRFSEQVQARGHVRLVYCSRQAASTRDFHSWYRNRTLRLAPLAPEALEAGASLPRTPGHLRHLRDIAAVYCERGWTLPDLLNLTEESREQDVLPGTG